MYFPVDEFKIPQIGLYNHLSYLQYHPNFPLLTDGHSDKKNYLGQFTAFVLCM